MSKQHQDWARPQPTLWQRMFGGTPRAELVDTDYTGTPAESGYTPVDTRNFGEVMSDVLSDAFGSHDPGPSPDGGIFDGLFG
jgi:hypothetical protein